VVKVAVCADAPSGVAETVYFVPEYGFLAEVHRVLASLNVPASVEPSLPVTLTEASVPPVTVTSTGSVNAAFPVPSAGLTETTGSFAALGDAVVLAASSDASADPSDASAEPLHPDSTAAAGAMPSTVSSPRRDHLRDGCSDRFDMCRAPTAGLPGMSTFSGCILRRVDLLIL
jgi:hypothetical protein